MFPTRPFSTKARDKVDTQSPFLTAAQMSDRRLGTLRTVARAAVALAITFALLCALLVFNLVRALQEKQVEFYVVEVDSSNRPTKVQQNGNAWKPTEAVIQRTMADLMSQIRSKPSDPVVQSKQYLRAYDFLAGDAVVTMNEFGRVRAQEKIVCSVEVGSVVRLSPESMQVDWTEETIDRGLAVDRAHWTGILRYAIKPPDTAEQAFKNPLGVFVTSISWSRDLRTARAPKGTP